MRLSCTRHYCRLHSRLHDQTIIPRRPACRLYSLTSSTSASHAKSSNHHHAIQIHPDVRDALLHHRPVVALESTILAHGMPYPQNLQLSNRLSEIFRAKNVQPATIAVQNGVCRVGLDNDEMQDLCLAGAQGRATKCSTRELPIMMAKRSRRRQHQDVADTTQWGATTVASTMHLAHCAGIAVFCTGGIGGVHRGAEVSMDISADLTELARTPVIVVSAGIKSILDIPRTLEVLETNGVLTLAYGTDEFPAFFSPRSGVTAPARVDTPHEVAALYWAARDLNLSHGISLAVPNHDPAGANVEDAIQAALQEASDSNISGQAVTPFILKRVAELTGGDSLRSNMALVEQNARVSADVAIAVCEEQKLRNSKVTVYGSSTGTSGTGLSAAASPSRVVVLGGCVFDLICRPEPGGELILQTSNPAICTEVDGGVGRNVAEVLGRLGQAPMFYSAVGADSRGQGLLQRLQAEMAVQIENSVQVVDHKGTATYVAAFDGAGDMHTAFADMAVLQDIVGPSDDILRQAKILVVDANPTIHVLRNAAQRAHDLGLDVYFEPTSVPKAREVARNAEFMANLTAAFPNAAELVTMASAIAAGKESDTVVSALQQQTAPADMSLESLQEHAATVLGTMSQRDQQAFLVITLGARGVLLATRQAGANKQQQQSQISFTHFPAPSDLQVVNSSGAGDSLCGAFVCAVLQDKSLVDAVAIGMKAAAMSLSCADRTVSTHMTKESLGM